MNEVGAFLVGCTCRHWQGGRNCTRYLGVLGAVGMHKPTLARVIAAPFLFFIVLLIAAWTSGYQEIICEETKRGEELCSAYNLAFFFLIKLREFVDKYDGLITALATLAIGAFTYTLWKSTDKLWRAGRDEFIAGRRPWTGIVSVKMGSSLSISETSVTGTLSFELRNFGNSPAEYVLGQAKFFAFEQVGDAVQFSGRAERTLGSVGTTIFPGQILPDQNIGFFTLPEEGFISPTQSGFLAGNIRYFFSVDDSFHTTPFVYLLSRNDGSALFDGNPTIIKADDLTILPTPMGKSPT
ncbi:mlr8038 [Mesorhizobium japonicum MAFF 303099]|uniref:Mlr8038 protein n=2 Tax=Mesorhizobium japonicum TaxID=2066070 RepID=Q984E5_RHILO|nr:mlr8038 [Mesorhizobium japonicum MAFF 303099]